MEHNRRIKPVIDMLLNNHSRTIKRVKMKPMVLQYIKEESDDSIVSEVSDITDVSDTAKENYEKNSNRKAEMVSDRSDRSVSDSLTSINKHVIKDSYSTLERFHGQNENMTSHTSLNSSSTSNSYNKSTIDIDEQIKRKNSILAGEESLCVYCNDFHVTEIRGYEHHVINKHRGHFVCPTDDSLRASRGKIPRVRRN